MISKSSEDLQFYEARLKFLRDQQSREEAADQRGEQRGELIGKIQLLEDLLGLSETAKEALRLLDQSQLSRKLAELEQKLSGRRL